MCGVWYGRGCVFYDVIALVPRFEHMRAQEFSHRRDAILLGGSTVLERVVKIQVSKYLATFKVFGIATFHTDVVIVRK